MHGRGKPLPPAPPAAAHEDTSGAPGGLLLAWRWLYGKPYLLLVLTTLIWAGNAIASRLAVGHISPLVLTTMRWIGVCVILLPVMRKPLAEAWPVLAPLWRKILLMGALGFTAFNALMYAAAHNTTAVNITLFQGSIPVFVLLGAVIAFGTRIRLLQALGTALTLIGVVLIAARGEVATLLALAFNVGDLWMLVACASYAAYTLMLRDRPAVPAFVFFSAIAAAALAVSLPLLVYEAASGAAIWPDGGGWLILLYVTLFPSLVSQIFYMRGVELIGPSRAGLFVNLVPVFGALLAVVILSEPFAWYHAVALALVLGGIWLAEQKRG
jgi:drug/metabolite transporter (DMT)-like permease